MGEIVKGHVSNGYEGVRELYERDFARGSDVDSQLCVYVKGERVVDLWGSHGPKRDPNYGPDSMQVGPQSKCRVRQKLNPRLRELELQSEAVSRNKIKFSLIPVNGPISTHDSNLVGYSE